MFPEEDKVGSVKLQHKSHTPKVMFICAITRPDPSNNFDGKIGIWRVFVMKEAQRTSIRHERGEEYEFDITIDPEWYQKFSIEVLTPEIQNKLPWLEGKDITVQQDGVPPHTGRDTPAKLNNAGAMGRWNI